MGKLNVLALKAPSRRVETREFEEGGQKLSLTLQEPNAADLACASEETENLTRSFITGQDDFGPVPFITDDVRPSKNLFQTCAIVASCQAATDERERYTALELAVLSVRMPKTWVQITQWVSDLSSPWKQSSGN